MLFFVSFLSFVSCIIHLQSPTAHLYLPTGTPLTNVVVSSGIISITNTIITSVSGEGIRYVGKCTSTNYVNFSDVTIVLNDSVNSPTTAVLDVDLTCESSSIISIQNVRILATGSCLTGNCASAGVRITGASTTTVSSLVVNDCGIGDVLNGYGTPLTQDLPTLLAGIEFNGNPVWSLAAWLTGDTFYDVTPPAYQQFPRNVRRRNPGLTGRPYDVLISPVSYGIPLDCDGVCRLICGNQCLVDPTRFPSGAADVGICWGITQFQDIAHIGALCFGTLAFVFPTEYPPTIITLNGSNTLRIEGWNTDLPLGPHATGVDMLRSRPLIRHAHVQSSTPWETLPHSIDIHITSLEIVSMDFIVESDYLFPFHGAILLTTTRIVPITTLTLRNCSFTSVQPVTFLLNNIAMDRLVDELVIEDCHFDGIGGGFVPDGLSSLDFLNNIVLNDDQFGLMDIAIPGGNGVRIIGNMAFNIGYFTTVGCNAVLCLSDTSGSIDISDNDFSGTLIGPQASNYIGIQLRNVSATVGDIFLNSVSGVMIGLDYADMPNIPCNDTELFLLKQGNPSITGYDSDIRCNGGLPSEITCSGSCFPPMPPPVECEVSSLYGPLTFGWMHDRFSTLGEAVRYCSSTPVQRILVRNTAPVFETGVIVFQLPFAEQTSMEIMRHPADTIGSNPIVFGDGHVFPENENLHVQFSYVDFSVFTTGADFLFSGYISNFSYVGGTLSAVSSPTAPPFGANAPLTDDLVILLVDTDGEGITLENCRLMGARSSLLKITDHPYEDPIPIRMLNVELSLTWGEGINMMNLWDVVIDDTSCIFWCGGLVEVNAVNSLIFLNDHPTRPLFVWIDDFSTYVNTSNSIQGSFPTIAPGGYGDRAGFWIENPQNVPTAGVFSFHVRDVSSVGHPVAARLVSTSEIVFELNEEVPPIIVDPRKILREFARVNNMVGSVHDMKKGLPTLDTPTLDTTHTCDDLCPPIIGPACEVNSAFNSLTHSWGTRRFADITTAISLCTLMTDPVAIQLVLVAEQTTVTHVEDILFDSMIRGVLLRGAESTFLVSLVGRHVISQSQVGSIIIEDLTLVLDDSLSPRDTPVIQVLTPPAISILALRRLNVNTGSVLVPYTGSVLSMAGGNPTMNIEIRSVTTSASVRGSLSNPLFDIVSSGGEVAVLTSRTDRSDGAALHIVGSSLVTITECSFSACLFSTAVPQPESCVYVALSPGGRIITSESSLSMASLSVLHQSTGRHLTGLWVQHSEIVIDPVMPLGDALFELKGWEMTGVAPGVGLRIPGISFAPAFLAMGQSDQKAYIRQISLNNPGIGSTSFYDVVLSSDDVAIQASPKTLERLWCSDLCVGFVTNSIIIYIIGGVVVFIGLMLLVLVAGPSIIGKESASLILARAAGKARRRLRKVRKRNEKELMGRKEM